MKEWKQQLLSTLDHMWNVCLSSALKCKNMALVDDLMNNSLDADKEPTKLNCEFISCLWHSLLPQIPARWFCILTSFEGFETMTTLALFSLFFQPVRS